MNVTIISPITYVAAHYEAVCQLMKQLTVRNIVLSEVEYAQMVASPSNRLFLLLYEERVVGMLTVGMYASPTGTKAWIEDVVVEEGLRGSGFGRRLMDRALEFCREKGIATVYLTSNPKRVAANSLYQRMGFVRKETNMYKLELME